MMKKYWVIAFGLLAFIVVLMWFIAGNRGGFSVRARFS
ncbi:MAG: hypothetical protein M2R45_04120 [Verrucomicrobia subdivision 3 bacterium]|nr:hypothetical protein [Limisphaerales bacterium]MCS1417077.1 hypothetical protein [Limisphaerales bacterium]